MSKPRDKGDSFSVPVATYLKSLLAGRDFAGVVAYYEANRGLIGEHNDVGAGEVHHLAAQAYAALSQLSAAVRAARTAQALITQSGDTLLLAEVFVVLGDVLRDKGDLKEAQRAYRDAESIFRRNDCPEGQCRALNQLAGLHFRRTDYPNALAVLLDAVELAKRLGDQQKLAYMMGNIGRLNTFMGRFGDAEKHLKVNIELSEALRDDLEAARAGLSLGYVYMQQARYAEAEDTWTKAYRLIVALRDRKDEIIYLSYLGELKYRTGDLAGAKSTLQRALAMSQADDAESTMAGRIMRHLAEVELRLGDLRQADRLATRAMVIMQKAGNKVERGALLRISAQLAEAGCRTITGFKADQARKSFVMAIEVLDESGVRWERAEALVAAGSSELFDMRVRLTYLLRAEEFYARNRINLRREEVSRLIERLDVPVGNSGEVRGAVAAAKELDYLTRCPEIMRIKGQLPLLAKSDLPLLITGETGTGKDHLARYFHSLARPQGPYVAINCASVPETLLESELFGYRKGAFTGADRNKPGLFEVANGGVLLLDEIGDMPLVLQAKLLGVLEKRKVMPLGGSQEVAVDFVLVAATNKNLEEMVEVGLFRRDLYYRLSGIAFRLPALRERKEDIPLLLEHFMRHRGLLAPDQAVPVELARQFVGYEWPGNIRELDNMVRRMEVLSQSVAEGDLVEVARTMLFEGKIDSQALGLFERVEQFERQLIVEALMVAGGNKSEAARLLGIHEATVRTKLKRYGIEAGGPTVT